MPRARVNKAIAVRLGRFSRPLTANRKSFKSDPIVFLDFEGREKMCPRKPFSPGNFLFVTQRHQWIYFRCAPRGDIASEQRDTREQDRNSDKSYRIGRRHAEEHASEHSRERKRRNQTECETKQN